MKDVLVDRITTVTDTERLSSTPMIIVDHESASFRRMMKSVDPQNTPELPKQQVQINGRHPLIVNINAMRTVDESLAKDAIEQLFDNALIQVCCSPNFF
jgi:HSP90 family molecular chaperone